MSVPPGMMGAGPMIPPAPPTAPAAPATGEPPAVAAMPALAALAQQQTLQVMEEQKRMAMMQEQMQKEIMLLIASLPTPNPAGEAAVTAPLTPMMSGAGAPMGESRMGMNESAGGAMMGGAQGAY